MEHKKIGHGFDDKNFDRAAEKAAIAEKTDLLLGELSRYTGAKQNLMPKEGGKPGKLEASQIAEFDKKIAKINAQLAEIYGQ